MAVCLADLIRPIDHTYKARCAALNWYKRPGEWDIGALCDICDNACGFCEWSEYHNMRPVPGWDAVEGKVPIQRLVNGKQRIVYETSYTVLDCPKFVCEAHRTEWLKHWDKEKRRRELQRRSKRKQEG